MNIAFLSIGFSGNRKEATAITLISLAKEFIKKGHYVCIISDRNGFNKEILKEKDKIENVPIFRPYKSRLMTMINGLNYVQKHEKIRFNVIHNFSNAPILALRGILAKRYSKNAKVIQTIKARSGKLIGNIAFSFILNFTDAVTVPTEAMKKSLTKWGCNKNKINVIRSHIDLEKFVPLNKEKIKEEYGYKGKKVILYYGAMRKGKGVDFLIDSIPNALKDKKDIVFVFAPRNFPYNKRYDEKIKEINKQVIILSKIPNKISDYVNLADIVVLPYPSMKSTEGNPSCLLESMACKTVVVTTDFPELREIVTDKKDVLMAKPKDSEDLTKKINELLNNKKLLIKLTTNAYKKVKYFDVKRIKEEYLKIYKK